MEIDRGRINVPVLGLILIPIFVLLLAFFVAQKEFKIKKSATSYFAAVFSPREDEIAYLTRSAEFTEDKPMVKLPWMEEKTYSFNDDAVALSVNDYDGTREVLVAQYPLPMRKARPSDFGEVKGVLQWGEDGLIYFKFSGVGFPDGNSPSQLGVNAIRKDKSDSKTVEDKELVDDFPRSRRGKVVFAEGSRIVLVDTVKKTARILVRDSSVKDMDNPIYQIYEEKAKRVIAEEAEKIAKEDANLRVTDTVPRNNSRNVATFQDILIYFNKTIDRSTINPANVIVSSQVPGAKEVETPGSLEFRYSEDPTYTLLIVARDSLEPGAVVRVDLTTGLKGAQKEEFKPGDAALPKGIGYRFQFTLQGK